MDSEMQDPYPSQPEGDSSSEQPSAEENVNEGDNTGSQEAADNSGADTPPSEESAESDSPPAPLTDGESADGDEGQDSQVDASPEEAPNEESTPATQWNDPFPGRTPLDPRDQVAEHNAREQARDAQRLEHNRRTGDASR